MPHTAGQKYMYVVLMTLTFDFLTLKQHRRYSCYLAQNLNIVSFYVLDLWAQSHMQADSDILTT